MTLYHVSVKCLHCGQHTFIDEMDSGEFDRAQNLLKPFLHSFACGHCQNPFSSTGGLVRSPQKPGNA